jgi:hypothetical protein
LPIQKDYREIAEPLVGELREAPPAPGTQTLPVPQSDSHEEGDSGARDIRKRRQGVTREPRPPYSAQRRAEALEELYAAVSSFIVDSTVYDGTAREAKYQLAVLKHRLPLLKELIARLDEQNPVAPTRKTKRPPIKTKTEPS